MTDLAPAISHAAIPKLGNLPAHQGISKEDVVIFDIRRNKTTMSLRDDIIRGLTAEEKTMPTMLLYDTRGLRQFERITRAPEYYVTNAEIDVLEEFADSMAEKIEAGSMIVELGSGNLRKVKILLNALERVRKNVEYYALDLSLDELKRTFADLPKFNHVKCFGLYGTYDDGLAWLQNNAAVSDRPKCILWLGSSIGNFERDDATAFVKMYAEGVVVPGRDVMLIGIDACKDATRVWPAYNDVDGVTEEFILNGLDHANRILDSTTFKRADWEYVGEYNEQLGCHQAFYRARKDVNLGKAFSGLVIQAGEKVRVERSHKYSESESHNLWNLAGVVESFKWGLPAGEYNLHLLTRPQ